MVGRYTRLPISERVHQALMFQSSPDLWSGATPFGTFHQACVDSGFNPRPTLWSGATRDSHGPQSDVGSFNPRPTLWSGATSLPWIDLSAAMP